MRSSSLLLAGVRFVLLSLTAAALLAGVTPGISHSQEGCGVGAGDFQIDGQFYSTEGFIDWAQGLGGLGVFDAAGMPLLTPALYDRDAHWAGSAADPDHFDGGNKNNDNIGLKSPSNPEGSPWTWGPGSGPQKNDLTDVYAYSKIVEGEIWLILGACTRANNGSSHIDVEFNQLGFLKTYDDKGDGIIVGNGPDAGRTADVDFIVSVDFTEGGKVPLISFRTWQAVPGGFEFLLATPGPDQVYVCTNSATVPAPPWGAVAPDGSAASDVIPYQFVEVALNLTALGIDPSVFCTDVSTLLFKTRAAASFEASLKDLALYQFSIIPPPECIIYYDDDSICVGETATFWGPDGDFTYTWTGPEGFTSSSQYIYIDVPGPYELELLDNVSGCTGGPCSHELVVNELPGCEIFVENDVICGDETATLCGPEPPNGVTYSYTWGGPEEPYPDASCITVNMEGMYSLVVTHTGTGCSSDPACEQYLTVNPLPQCDIEGPAFICSGFTAELRGPEGDYTYVWGGPGPSYPNAPSIIVGETGTYTLTVTDNSTGCSNGTCEHELAVGDPPACTIAGPDAICEGTEGRLCGPEGDYEYLWEGPGVTGEVGSCVMVSEEATYSLAVTDIYGCRSTCTHAVTINSNTRAGELSDLWLCTGERAEFCVEVTGTPPFFYVWTKDGNVIEGATESCYVIPSITADDVGRYCVEVTGACGPPLTRCADLTLADVAISELNNLYLCPDQSGEFCVVPSGKGPFIYQWKKNDVDIPGATDSCYTVPSASEADEGIYCVEVTGACGPSVEECAILLVGTCELFCTKTQGFYGNYGGKWNGMTTLELIQSLITPSDPLIVGVLGIRSITFPDGSERCIIDLLPSGGPAAKLKQPLGDHAIDPVTCGESQYLPLKNGRIRNVLLGQVITLSLNTRLDPSLESMPICELMIAIPALPGPDGVFGTGDEIPDPDGEARIMWIPVEVLDALTALGMDHNVGNLLELANLGLAGEGTEDANLNHINRAVSTINELYDNCALVIACEDGDYWFASVVADHGSGGEELMNEEVAAPAPQSAIDYGLSVTSAIQRSSRISFIVPERSRVKLAMYDVSGRLVLNVMEDTVGAGTTTIPLAIEGRKSLPSGVYFLRMQATGEDTGRRFGRVQKMILVR
jgi:hypothetical protein